jgi:hypothetical protein
MSPSPKSPPDPHIFRECNWRAHASVDVRRPAGRPRWCSWSSAAVRNPYVIRDCGLARTAPDCRRAGLPNRLPTLVWLSDRLELAGPGGLGCPSRPEQSTGAQTIGCLPMERGHAEWSSGAPIHRARKRSFSSLSRSSPRDRSLRMKYISGHLSDGPATNANHSISGSGHSIFEYPRAVAESHTSIWQVGVAANGD